MGSGPYIEAGKGVNESCPAQDAVRRSVTVHGPIISMLLQGVLISAPSAPADNSLRLAGVTPNGTAVVIDEHWSRQGDRLHLIRDAAVGDSRICLEISLNLKSPRKARVVYRRSEPQGSPVALALTEAALTIQVGSVTSREAAPPPAVPTSMLRFLDITEPVELPLFLEPFGVVAQGRVRREGSSRPGHSRLVWEAAGITERMDLDEQGAPVEVWTPTSGLSLLRVRSSKPRPQPEPCDPPSQVAKTSFETLPGKLPDWVKSPLQLQRWVTRLVTYAPDAKMPTASEVLERRQADCAGMAILAGAAARQRNWPVRHVLGTVTSPAEGTGWHQWVEIFHRGQWHSVDPAAPPGNKRALHRFDATPHSILRNELVMLLEEAKR